MVPIVWAAAAKVRPGHRVASNSLILSRAEAEQPGRETIAPSTRKNANASAKSKIGIPSRFRERKKWNADPQFAFSP